MTPSSVAGPLAAAAVLFGGYAFFDARHEDPPVSPALTPFGAERARAKKAAVEFARACRPPCSLHSLQPISPGVWRVHLNFEFGYCVLIDLDRFRRTRAGTHVGWRSTNCVGRPR